LIGGVVVGVLTSNNAPALLNLSIGDTAELSFISPDLGILSVQTDRIQVSIIRSVRIRREGVWVARLESVSSDEMFLIVFPKAKLGEYSSFTRR
jgi:hypothetical protein